MCANWRQPRARVGRWCWRPPTGSWPSWNAARTTRPISRYSPCGCRSAPTRSAARTGTRCSSGSGCRPPCPSRPPCTPPAHGTSKYCPRCLTALRHHKAPNDPAPGWKWATCPNPACGYSADRDVAAWQRIGARGLTHQPKTVLDRTTGTLVIRSVAEALDQPVQHSKTDRTDRTKSGPTRNRPLPRQRRRVPTPPGSTPGGTRPAGRPPKHRPTRTTARQRRQQVPHTMSSPIRHQPYRARLGAGFHHHAHATRQPSHFPGRPENPGPPRKTQAHPGKPKPIRDASPTPPSPGCWSSSAWAWSAATCSADATRTVT
jgi:hypothetical protein